MEDKKVQLAIQFRHGLSDDKIQRAIEILLKMFPGSRVVRVEHIHDDEPAEGKEQEAQA